MIPLPSYVDSFGETPPTGVQLATGSYTQATASLGLKFGNGFIGMVASYRKDRHLPSDYTIGPTVNYPVINRGRFQLVFEATAERTRSTTAAFAGLRALFSRGSVSVGGSLGESVQHDRDDVGQSRTRTVGNVTAQYSHEGQDGTILNVEAGADRSIDTSTLNAGTTVYSRLGNLRADLIQNVEGSRQTQYDVSYETGIALTKHAASLGGKDLQQSALIVTVHGDSGASFNVLVDEVVRGRVKAGQRFSLFLSGYRTYGVRLVPTASATLDYDSATREVTLFPGNVQLLDWRTESFFTIFAQAMTSKGAPIVDALVRSPKGISQTDRNGYFQLDVRNGDPVTIEQREGQTCQVALPKVMTKNDFASLGRVVCS